MNWSDLSPTARAAILAVLAVVLVLVVWTWVVAPARARQATVSRDLASAETQLDQIEREVESIPPATESERAAWQASADELAARLAPESELPLLLESLTRLAESQNVELFMTSGGAAPISANSATGPGTQSQQVLAGIPGVRYVPLAARVYGDYASISRFIGQIGRLGWVTEIAGVSMERSFPEVATDLDLVVFFRGDETDPSSGAGNGAARSAPGRAGLGG